MSLEIILYDSSPVTKKILSHVLYHYAPTVYSTDKAAELIDKIQYTKPDIIFMDYPSSQSLEQSALKKITKKTHSQNIPVILITPDNSTPESSLTKDFLNKPIEATKLTELVNRFVPKTKSNILSQHLQFQQFPSPKQSDNQKTKEPAVANTSKKELNNVDVIEVSKEEASSFIPQRNITPPTEELSVENNVEAELKTIHIDLEEGKLIEPQASASSPEKKPSLELTQNEDMVPLDTSFVEETISNAVQDNDNDNDNDNDTKITSSPSKNNDEPMVNLSVEPAPEIKIEKTETVKEPEATIKEPEPEATIKEPEPEPEKIEPKAEATVKELELELEPEPQKLQPEQKDDSPLQQTKTIDDKKVTEDPLIAEKLEKTIQMEADTQVRQFIDEHLKTGLKEHIQKIIPNLAREIIKEELAKLLKETDNDN